MPLPSSGQISINDINTEFSRGTNLNAYRGTSYFTTAGGTGTFPAGQIGMSDFYNTALVNPKSVTFTHQAGCYTSQLVNPVTYSNVPIGTAAANRTVYVFALAARHPFTLGICPDVISLSIGGVAGTLLLSSSIDNAMERSKVFLYGANVPTGTTATITYTVGNSSAGTDGNFTMQSIGVYAAYGLTSPLVLRSFYRAGRMSPTRDIVNTQTTISGFNVLGGDIILGHANGIGENIPVSATLPNRADTWIPNPSSDTDEQGGLYQSSAPDGPLIFGNVPHRRTYSIFGPCPIDQSPRGIIMQWAQTVSFGSATAMLAAFR